MTAENVKRRCGDCTACCTVLAVKELGLAEGERCQHQKRHGGCAIYDERPEGCHSFECLWLQGGMAVKDRPDRIGVVFSSNADGTLVQAFELHQNVASHGRAKMWIERFREIMDVAVLRGPNKPRTMLMMNKPKEK